VDLRRCDSHFPVCVHPSPRTLLQRKLIVLVLNPRLRRAPQCEQLPAAASRPHWNWRERFLSGCSPPGYARIATAADPVRLAHAAAIVAVEDRECGVRMVSDSGSEQTAQARVDTLIKPEEGNVLPLVGALRRQFYRLKDFRLSSPPARI